LMNLRKVRSEPCKSVAKKRRVASFFGFREKKDMESPLGEKVEISCIQNTEQRVKLRTVVALSTGQLSNIR
jgi:hypothetical protein